MSDLRGTLQLGHSETYCHIINFNIYWTYEVLNNLQNGFEHGTSVQNSFVISCALCMPLGCFLCLNAQACSPFFFYLLRASLLFCGFTHCIVFSLSSTLTFLDAFTIFSITEEDYIALAKNYAVVVKVNVIKYLLLFLCRFKQMIHNYMEHLERTKLHQLTGGDQLESTTHSRIR